MTAELARVWSLPAPMLAAYQYRAFPQTNCEERLGPVVAAGIVAVENTEAEESEQTSLTSWAVMLGLEAEDIQEMAQLSDRQKERVQSLASNMTR